MENSELSDFVLVRTESAGVHVGLEGSRDGDVIVLNQSRRIHYWEGACSCSEIAINGIKDLAKSRIAIILPKITLRGWIEIIPMTKKAAQNVMEAEVWSIQ